MKRTTLATVLLLFSTTFRAGADDAAQWNLLSVVKGYLGLSSLVQSDIETIEDLETDLEVARVRRDSTLSLEEKALQLNSARLRVRETINAEVMTAVDLYLSYVSALREAESARSGLAIAERVYRITKDRYDAQNETEKELLSGARALLQTKKSLAAAERDLEQSYNALIRALDLETGSHFEIEILWTEETPEEVVLDTDLMQEASSEYHQAYGSVLLKDKHYRSRAESKIFTREEIEAAQDELEKAQNQLQSVIWNQEDKRTTLQFQLTSLRADTEILDIDLRLATMDLEQLELQFRFGEVFETDLDSSRQKALQAEVALLKSQESLFRLHLDAVDANGGDCREALANWLVS